MKTLYEMLITMLMGFPGGSVKNLPPDEGDVDSTPWVGKIHLGRKQESTPVFLPEKSLGQRNLVSYSL